MEDGASAIDTNRYQHYAQRRSAAMKGSAERGTWSRGSPVVYVVGGPSPGTDVTNKVAVTLYTIMNFGVCCSGVPVGRSEAQKIPRPYGTPRSRQMPGDALTTSLLLLAVGARPVHTQNSTIRTCSIIPVVHIVHVAFAEEDCRATYYPGQPQYE
jgi:hypothetical protein